MALRLFENPRDLEEMRRTHGSFLGWKRVKASSVIGMYAHVHIHIQVYT